MDIHILAIHKHQPHTHTHTHTTHTQTYAYTDIFHPVRHYTTQLMLV